MDYIHAEGRNIKIGNGQMRTSGKGFSKCTDSSKESLTEKLQCEMVGGGGKKPLPMQSQQHVHATDTTLQ